MKRLTLITTVLLLALPGVASAAAGNRAVVVSIGASGREVQVVDAAHAVRSFRLQLISNASGRGTARTVARLTVGSVISYRQLGSEITDVQITGRSHTVSYYASVIRSSARRVLVRLADGSALSLAAGLKLGGDGSSGNGILAHAAATKTPAGSARLAAGTTVLVTESVSARGRARFSLSLPCLSGAGASATVSSDTGRQLAQG